MDDIFLSAKHIVKRFDKVTALDDVSVEVPRGRIFGMLGPNGAGKTTLIRIINRITAPDSGEVFFDGHKFSPDDVMRIGYLPEERGLYKKMKVGEQAVYLAQLKGLSKSEATERLRHWFEKFEIMPWWNKKLEELSKGMQQKVQFVITVLHRPPLLIFDEPFSGFDPVNAELLKREILALRDEGHTVIFSTHNMSSVEEVCDEMALVNHGKIILNGNVAEVKRKFRTGVYELVCSGGEELTDEEGHYRIVNHEVRAGEHHYLIQKAPALTNSALVGLLSEKTEIRTFNEQMPTMNEIFIHTVEANNAALNAQNHE